MLSDDELDTLRALTSDLQRAQGPLSRLDAYYDGQQRLERLGLAVPPELEQFTTLVNWPRITVDSVEQRCDVEGFRVPTAAGKDDEATADELWGIWQANDLDVQSQLGHLESMVLTRAYVCVGARADDEPQPNVPLITLESPFEVIHQEDRRTRRVTAAVRRSGPKEATLYLPDVTIWAERKGRGGWTEVDRDEHRLGVVPVVPLLNKPRLRPRRARLGELHTRGVSEMADVILLTDAACRALTNAQLATEVLAVPQRWALGMSKGDFVDKDGKRLTAWETYFGAVWAMTNKDAKVGQFSAADLQNFERIVNHYANLVSGVSGLPTRFFGQYTTNPPSEGSIVADETRLIMNANRKHRVLGAGWELAQRIAMRIARGVWTPALDRMETLWRSAETPTRAQTADAVVKLVQADVLPVEAAWEELGYSATRREQLRVMRAAQLDSDPLKRAADAFATPVQPAPSAGGELQLPEFDDTVPGLRAS